MIRLIPRGGSIYFCRFASTAFDCSSHSLRGVFSVAAEALDSESIPRYLADSIAEELKWFNQNMNEPKCFKNPKWNYEWRAMCWLKSTAEEHIIHAWNLKILLNEANFLIEYLITNDPGAIIWQDEYQVVAKAWRILKDGRVGT